MHSLANASSVFQSYSLEPPYGNCKKSQTLRLFGANVSYTVAKCRLECDTDRLVRECGCKEPHMPGICLAVKSFLQQGGFDTQSVWNETLD